MKIPAALLVAGVALFFLSLNLPMRFAGASWLVFYASLACIAGGTIWGLIRGPAPVRVAVGLAVTSLGLFFLAMVLQPMRMHAPGPPPAPNIPEMNQSIAIIAAIFLVLAVMQGIRADRALAPDAGVHQVA